MKKHQTLLYHVRTCDAKRPPPLPLPPTQSPLFVATSMKISYL